MRDVNPDIAESIPGKDSDRTTPRGELNWILTAITDTIAWNVLPARKFQKLFRMDSLLASLYRNFLLAQRIMKSFRCTPQSWPIMPDSTIHPLWRSWDMAVESFLSHYVAQQRALSLTHPRNNMAFNVPSNLSFFNDQLSAFEMWLEFGTASSPPPPMLPVVLQVLLSKTHRLRVLSLLRKFLSLGLEAIRLSLILGIFPYVLKLLKNPSDDIKHLVVSVWASIIGFDPSCRQELVRDKVMGSFVQGFATSNTSTQQRCLSAFVLAEVCNPTDGYKEGQQACLQLSLHRICTSMLPNHDVMGCSTLKLWTCLCLFKLCEDFPWAKYLCVTEAGHTRLYPLLIDPDPTVRAAAVLALGELFGASSLTQAINPPLGSSGMMRHTRSSLSSGSEDSHHRNSIVEDMDLREAELQLALQILECCTDGSVLVRLESISALSKFFVQAAHIDCIKLVAKAIYLHNLERKKPMPMKPDRRSASPNLEGGSSFSRQASSHHCPWHLTPLESSIIAQQVEAFIKTCMEQRSGGDMSLQRVDSNSNSSSGMYSSQQPHATNAANTSIFGNDPPKSPTRSGASGNNSNNNSGENNYAERKYDGNTSSPGGNMGANKPKTPEITTLMASTYVRLWLALIEVQGKDPHSLVAQAATDISFRIHVLLALDEKHSKQTPPDMVSSADSAGGFGNLTPTATSGGNTVTFDFGNTVAASNGSSSNPASLNLFEQRLKREASGQISEASYHAAALASPARTGSSRSYRVTTSGSNNSLTKALSFGNAQQHEASNPGIMHSGGPAIIAPTATRGISAPQIASNNNNNLSPNSSGKFPLLEAFRDYLHHSPEDLMVRFSTNLYEMSRKQFLEFGQEYEPYQDVLSTENRNKAFRSVKLQEMLSAAKYYRDLFQESEDRMESLMYGERKSKSHFDDNHNSHHNTSSNNLLNMSGHGRTKSPALVTSPSNIVKFEQDNTLKLGVPMATTQLMFHAFQDILVVASGSAASVWSLQSKSKILEIKNKQSARGMTAESLSSTMAATSRRIAQDGISSPPSHSSHDNNAHSTGAHTTSSNSTGGAGRITSMTWINESYDALLLLGSDDGIVRIWRDVASSDSIQQGIAHAQSQSYHEPNSSGGGNNNTTTGPSPHHSSPVHHQQSSLNPPNIELVAAFAALPDIAETSRGSGVVFSWQQSAGTLVVGGNSSTIRVWDLGREQNVRVFQTGVETCLTAMTTNTVCNRFSQSVLSYPIQQNGWQPEMDSTPVTWTFAGFADGSIGVYDERVSSNGGRVHFSHTSSGWVNFAHLRADVPEVIIGSVRGSVKFWDLRTMRTHKTLEVQKSPITSMAVHNCAPIMATGSHAQFIKILTLGGEQLGNIIKYYDGFLGERIGPISSLAFHPYKLLLAASSTTGLISLYHAGDSHHHHHKAS